MIVRARLDLPSVANMIQLVGSEEEARLLIGEADFHHNHAINYDEFRRLMRLPEHKELISQDDLSMNSLERLARKWYEAPEDDKQYVDRTFTGYQEGFQLCMIQLPQRVPFRIMHRIPIPPLNLDVTGKGQLHHPDRGKYTS